MFFQSRQIHTGLIFKVSKIFKGFDKTAFENCIFNNKSLKELMSSIFNNWFKFSFESHSHDTRWSNLDYLKIRSYRTKTYGRYSMFVNSIYVWNHLQSSHQNNTHLNSCNSSSYNSKAHKSNKFFGLFRIQQLTLIRKPF